MAARTLTKENLEYEIRFLEVDEAMLSDKLRDSGAVDHGETLVDEEIYYDQHRTWMSQNRFARVRIAGGKSFVTYKRNHAHTSDGTEEIEFEVTEPGKVRAFLCAVGLEPIRRQQKLRRTWSLGSTVFDFDTWPNIPTYLEIEGQGTSDLRFGVDLLNLDMRDADTHNAAWIIENVYRIPVRTMSEFIF